MSLLGGGSAVRRRNGWGGKRRKRKVLSLRSIGKRLRKSRERCLALRGKRTCFGRRDRTPISRVRKKEKERESQGCGGGEELERSLPMGMVATRTTEFRKGGECRGNRFFMGWNLRGPLDPREKPDDGEKGGRPKKEEGKKKRFTKRQQPFLKEVDIPPTAESANFPGVGREKVRPLQKKGEKRGRVRWKTQRALTKGRKQFSICSSQGQKITGLEERH